MNKSPEDYLQQQMEASHAISGDRCDFCSDVTPIAKRYPCADFEWEFGFSDENGKVLEVIHQQMIGAWCACAECVALIDAQEWELLAELAAAKSEHVQIGADIVNMPAATPIEVYRSMFAGFRKHRKLVN
jgi:hypothetical protein